MVEIIVVAAIVLLLGGIAIVSLRGASASTRLNEAKVAAAAYAQAVSQYQADNANRNPPALAGAAAQKGPLNLLGRPYLAPMPEAVTDGRVGVSMNNANCGGPAAPAGATAGMTAWISLCTGGVHGTAPGFGIRLITRAKPGGSWTADGAQLCWLGNSRATPRC